MPEHRASLLAVVQLMETGAYARELRINPALPLAGYCLVEGNTENLRISAYVENLRPPGAAGPSLHAWTLTAETAVSLGPFADPETADRMVTYACEAPTDRLTAGTGLWITAGLTGPMGMPILEGPLVWLRAPGQPEPLADDGPALPATADPATDLPTGDTAADASELCDESPAPPDIPIPIPEAEEAILAHLTAETLTPQPPTQALDCAGPADAATAFADLEAPSAPATFSIPLSSQHPLAPRAGGTATLTPSCGGLLIVLRGLPNAATLGRDPQTGHPYSGYRAWLVSQRSRVRVAAGLCTRLWGDNYRLQVDAGLPLQDYDAVLITAADRNATVAGTDTPRVLLGPYKVL